MARDEKCDIYVQRDLDGKFIGFATQLQSYELYEEMDASDTVTRYSPASQLETVEADRDEWFKQHEILLGKWRAEEQRRIAAQKRVTELELHIRNLAARVDGDGGHAQTGEPIDETVKRTDRNIVALKVIQRCKDGCEHWVWNDVPGLRRYHVEGLCLLNARCPAEQMPVKGDGWCCKHTGLR